MKDIHIRWGDIPKGGWIGIILINPSECKIMQIPNSGKFVVYKAYFPFMKKEREFGIVFPYNKFNRAIKSVKPNLRQNLERPIKFEFKKTYLGTLHIRNWEPL